MPAGFASAKKAIEERPRGGSSGGAWWTDKFQLKDKQEATVRFLEQGDDVQWCWMMQLPPKGNQRWGDLVPTLDVNNDGAVDCPFKERISSNAKMRGFINLIWRDAPVYKRDEKGWIVKDGANQLVIEGTADRVVVWELSQPLLELLGEYDTKMKGLCSRDVQVSRSGTGFDTKYIFFPLDPTPISDADKKLASEKFDLAQFTTPPSHDEALRLLSGDKEDVQSHDEAIAAAKEFEYSPNPFMDKG